MWLLARALLPMIGSKVPIQNPQRRCFQLHLKILFMVMSPEVHQPLLQILPDVVEAHHILWKQCYPNQSLTPKLHYYCHYKTSIEEYILLDLLIY